MDAARTQESDERSDDMNEKDDEIGHLTVFARTAYRQELCGYQQFAIDSCIRGWEKASC
jgi:hypothetical protein